MNCCGDWGSIFGYRTPACTENSVESETSNAQELGEEGIPSPLPREAKDEGDEGLNIAARVVRLSRSNQINLHKVRKSRSVVRDQDAALHVRKKNEKYNEADEEKCNKRISSLEQDLASATARVAELTKMMKERDDDLQYAQTKIVAQEKKLLQGGESLQRAYASAVSVLAQEVSREVPDDVIRNELKTFFQGDFLSWCAKMCTSHAINKRTLELLEPWDIFNINLGFDCDLPDGRSALFLLQAMLSRFLCIQFLTNAYFLAADPNAFLAVEHALAAGSVAASVNWRIQTVQCLAETTTQLNAFSFVRLFETYYGFLLRDMDERAREDLATIIHRFAQLSIKLWKVPATIQVVGMAGFAEEKFKLGDRFTECEAQLLSELGDLVNGRPIGVILQPLIVAHPVAEREEQEVVWSKAIVWVLSRKIAPISRIFSL
ncbi:hypothetical protein H634G_11148 [Metarhizium anisopliae BRIP 53293]|uniref:Uncharacterized protein n=1 Tax=Metarhizium anisopliae BRIP 53293 TaxID=1291518 RepID=A0A0D9NLW8_METAN|nr:hypothetical protein H634G_11148 [Metarhizium anisopliae BRIP 53293]KJK85760.1 hypothetical protein H633G_10397 [Metarhizium anisopliae BRIP 53284]